MRSKGIENVGRLANLASAGSLGNFAYLAELDEFCGHFFFLEKGDSFGLSRVLGGGA